MTKEIELPMNFMVFGEVENDDVKVYIKQDVYKSLEKYSSSNTSKELGAIIIGEHCEQLGKTYVIISNYIEAKYTEASESTLTFTHETWDYIHKEHDKKFPDKKILGWQHTHPNYGIFLSNFDIFIHENFFNMPFQVAYVIDPIQNIRGFFQWKNGKIEKLKGFYIYDDVGKPIKIEQKKVEKSNSSQIDKSKKASSPLLIVLYLLTICLLIATVVIAIKYNEQEKSQATIVNQLLKQDATIEKQSNDIIELKEQLNNNIFETPETTYEALLIKLEGYEITLQNQEEIISELKALIDNSDRENATDLLRIHTVGEGENLSKICSTYGIDYDAYKNIILSLNKIENPNQVYTGQKILLPTTNK